MRELNKVLGAKKNDIENAQFFLTNEFNKDALVLISARVGIYLVLKAYNFRKDDEVLVPQYISHCVIDIVKKVCRPVYRLTDKTKAIILFHQFGYPQKMDEIYKIIGGKDILVIEDCAHSFYSRYKDKRIGLFGEAAIFSFPKIFPTILGGCLITDNTRILNYAYNYLRRNKSFWKEIYHNFILIPTFINGAVKNRWIKYVAALMVAKNWKLFHKFPNPNELVCHLLEENIKDVEYHAKKRQANLKLIKQRLKDCQYLDKLEEECEVVPFAVPYFCREPERICEEMGKFNILTGVNQFDMNRNIFSPRYEKVIALPVHQDLSSEEINYMLEVLKYVESKINKKH
jgi:dTDP-4-amino-4,6-dideoxygalactose transaminase